MGKVTNYLYSAFIVLLTLAVIGLVTYNIYLTQIRNSDNDYLSYKSGSNVKRDFNASKSDLPITYKINLSTCGSLMAERFNNAFKQIAKETEGIVSFQRVEGLANIDIICYLEVSEEGEYFTSAHATVGKIGGKADNAKMTFYNVDPIGNSRFSGGCVSYPNTEIHEIMHIFGYGHNETVGSIMNPISSGCRVLKIDDYIISDLKRVYIQ